MAQERGHAAEQAGRNPDRPALYQKRRGVWIERSWARYAADVQAFAAGAILTMLASTMMPEAYEEGGAVVGLVTTAGFLLAFVLSRLE